MLCPKCGAKNTPVSRYCFRCQTVLPRMMSPENLSLGSLDFDDTIEYLHPSDHYETEAIAELHHLALAALEGEQVLDDLEEHLEAMATTYADFEKSHMRPFMEVLKLETANGSGDPLPRQLLYVLETGYKLFDEGHRLLLLRIQEETPSPQDWLDALHTLGEGHDYIYFGIELAEIRAAG